MIRKNPPAAKKINYSYPVGEKEIKDPYFWLRDPKWPKVENKEIIDFLKEENKYYDSFFDGLETKKEELFRELKSRIKLEDVSTPVEEDNYFYYTRTEADKDYPIYCRKKDSLENSEEIILNVNELAAGKSFFRIGSLSVSPDHRLLAYSFDISGDEKYEVALLDLETRAYLGDSIKNTIGGLVWHEKLNGFFYSLLSENWRRDRVMFHYLGEDSKKDRLIFKEPDPLYTVSVGKSSSDEYIFLDVSGHDSNEMYFFDMEDSGMEPKLFRRRKDGIEYEIDHRENYFYVRSNEKAKNYKIYLSPVKNFTESEDFIPEEKNRYLEGFDLTKNYLILNYSELGLPSIKIKNLNDLSEKTIGFPDEAFTAGAYSPNFKKDRIRISYSSLGRPELTYSYDFNSETLKVIKEREIPCGFDAEEYKVERIFAPSEGAAVPISIFYKKNLFKKDGTNPLYLYGYGSYGIGVEPFFRNSAVSLANRGFVFALAHIRGGDDLGRDWYESAKFLNKKRTFNDFINCAEELVKKNYSYKGGIAICGGSAGGMLIGNVLNQRPDLFKAAIAHVPFVDVLNTMLDETLPLTPGEFKEWGNPKEPEYFDYISSYCPYRNVKKARYPSIMVTAGLSDPRVGYWEAAKWVARLREYNQSAEPIILKTNMDFGHSGASGRFDSLKETAEDLVFLFKTFAII